MQFLWKEAPDRIVIEVGPRTTLTTLSKQIAADQKDRIAVATLDIGQKSDAGTEPDEEGAFLNAVGHVWSLGGNVDFDRFFAGEERRRMVLPTYPFQRKRYWIDPPAGRTKSSTPVPEELTGMADVFSRQLALMDVQLDLLASDEEARRRK
jgi:acyl transferase domain-containing protein